MSATAPLRIGVLDIQGDVLEHVIMMDEVLVKRNIASETVVVKHPEQIDMLDGLIIPGGESTVMSRFISEKRFGAKLASKIREKAKNGMAIFGTCAGAILLSKASKDHIVEGFEQSLLELMDIKIIRNRYGRQQESFEQSIKITEWNEDPFPGVFIRAPVIIKAKKNVKVLARNDSQIFAAQQNNCLAVTFHPELTDDTRFHEYFLELILENRKD
ncbi:MAG: pyridoxal 5'-phosphate synthase glutaminase subunit PdxT [Asgard group archaeon]|nr:pyridoxal 5'-phosphate synthase glutaminase subunit PdxT [Asgard group archaeon]